MRTKLNILQTSRTLIAPLDDSIKELDDRKLRDDTLIIFTSDNGPETLNRYPGSQRSYGKPNPLRGMKLHTHDAGFRVAGIMNWRGNVEPNQVIRTPLSSLDFLPTFCDTSADESLAGS